jgi:hypothetical protein
MGRDAGNLNLFSYGDPNGVSCNPITDRLHSTAQIRKIAEKNDSTNSPVSCYLVWFGVRFHTNAAQVTVRYW